jgi:hypothetical protein
LFDPKHGLEDGICPYIIGNKGYPLLPLFMIPNKQTTNVRQTILKSFYNKHLRMGRVIVEITLIGILKKKFKKLLFKNNLHILFLPDVITYYLMLYNLILDGRDVDPLMSQLAIKDVICGVGRN